MRIFPLHAMRTLLELQIMETHSGSAQSEEKITCICQASTVRIFPLHAMRTLPELQIMETHSGSAQSEEKIICIC
jgi:hypothetical protein